MKITLSKPLTVRDEALCELELDLSALTGKDLLDVEAALKAKGISVAAWEYSRSFCAAVAAKALGIPSAALNELPASDFTKIVNETLIFLAGQESSDLTA